MVKIYEAFDVTSNVAVHNCNVGDVVNVVNQRFFKNYFDAIRYSAGKVDAL